MNYRYKAYYSILIDVPLNQSKDRDMVITAPNPVRALDVFHKQVQTMKPMLKHDQYAIKSFVQCYPDEVKGRPMIESAIDLPASPNPDLTSKPQSNMTTQQAEMPLDDARKPA